MIHFFLTFSKDAANSPFGRKLTELGIDFRIMAGEIRHRFKHRLWMVFIGRPATALFALRAAWRSLALESQQPCAVVVWTHIEVLIVGLVRWLLRRETSIVLVGFILTERTGGLHNLLRRLYFRRVLTVAQLVIVHSRAEAERYSQQFADLPARFAFIPWGSHIDDIARLERDAPAAPADVICAGKSGRDYPTLFRALGGTSMRVKVVCDLAEALADCAPAENIEVLDRCYGDAYLREVVHARCVAIPLGVGDISAGQMVLLQAMELGKATVITRTQTTVDYVRDGHDALLVDAGNPQALRDAVERLLGDEDLRGRIGQEAKRSFNERFTIPALVESLVTEIQRMDARAGRVRN
jgi:glycosyltransferase involved in cell wall biosynthesis